MCSAPNPVYAVKERGSDAELTNQTPANTTATKEPPCAEFLFMLKKPIHSVSFIICMASVLLLNDSDNKKIYTTQRDLRQSS